MQKNHALFAITAICLIALTTSTVTAANLVREYDVVESYEGGPRATRIVTPAVPVVVPQVIEVVDEVADESADAVDQTVENTKDTVGGVAGKVADVAKAAVVAIKDLLDYEIGKGGRLAANTAEVLVDEHNVCAWLDNNTSREYFVPLKTRSEWESFINHDNPGIVRGNCCRPATATLIASNGDSVVEDLPYGREGALDDRGSQTLSNTFAFVRALDGANVVETVTQTFTCQGRTWVAGGPTTETEVVEEEPVTSCDANEVAAAPIVLEGGSCTKLDPARNLAGPGVYHDLLTNQQSAGYQPGYHCLGHARNWGARVVLDANRPEFVAGKPLTVSYSGHLPSGTKTVSFTFDPGVSGEVFRDGNNSGKYHLTTIRYDAAAKQFILDNVSGGWGNCKDIQCGGLVAAKLTVGGLTASSCEESEDDKLLPSNTTINFDCWRNAGYQHRIVIRDEANTSLFDYYFSHKGRRVNMDLTFPTPAYKIEGYFNTSRRDGREPKSWKLNRKGWRTKQLSTNVVDGKTCHQQRWDTEDGKNNSWNDVVCMVSWCK